MFTWSSRSGRWSVCHGFWPAGMAIPEAALIVAFRNVLAHGYATLYQSRVYDPATTKVAALIAAIRTLLDEFPGG